MRVQGAMPAITIAFAGNAFQSSMEVKLTNETLTKQAPAPRVVIAAVSRVPFGKQAGVYCRGGLSATDLAAHTIARALRKAKVTDLSLVEMAPMGQAVQSFFEPNAARMAAQKAGLPDSSSAYTVMHQCGSGMNAIYQLYAALKLGNAKLGVATGSESMSFPPLIIAGSERYRGLNAFLTTVAPKAKLLPKVLRRFKSYGPLFHFGLAESGLGPMDLSKDPEKLNMILTAQIAGELTGITRQMCDEYAVESFRRALAAQSSGRLAMEIDPIVVPRVGLVEFDENPRPTSIEKAMSMGDTAGSGIITPITASPLGDGACSLVLCTEQMAYQLGVTPLCEVEGFAFAGRHATTMGLAPVQAIRALCSRLNWRIEDQRFFEINSAFGAQVLACMKLLGIPHDKINLFGDGLSFTHPLGATGARITASAAIELSLSKEGPDTAIASLCIAGGQAVAIGLRRYMR